MPLDINTPITNALDLVLPVSNNDALYHCHIRLHTKDSSTHGSFQAHRSKTELHKNIFPSGFTPSHRPAPPSLRPVLAKLAVSK